MEDLLVYIEQVQYESRPLLYAGLSIYSFLGMDVTPALFASGVILAVCSFYVFKMRYVHRSRLIRR